MQFALRDRRTARAEPALLASLLLLGLLSPAGTVVARAQAGGEDPFLAIPWQEGPTTGDLGGIAEVDVPAGYLFTDGNGARQFLELNQNPPSGQEQGLILPVDGEWFVTLDFVPSGYVRDDERDTLDADALFESIRAGNDEGNKMRAAQGWTALDLLGWQREPFYDLTTNNLTWAILGSSEGYGVVNYAVRLLGRGGVMNMDLVLDPDELDRAMPHFNSLVSGLSFTSGNRYAEYVQGDKLAAYGLTALVAGGAGALAVQTGFLAKFWKFIVAGFVGLVGLIRAFFSRFFGRKQDQWSR